MAKQAQNPSEGKKLLPPDRRKPIEERRKPSDWLQPLPPYGILDLPDEALGRSILEHRQKKA